jgi:phosphoribosylamine--glycine ligase
VFAVTDGKHYCILPEAKDYKRIGEGDTGPNTGGMGSISAVPFVDAAFMQRIEARIIAPTVSGLAEEGIPYLGFIFFGLINVNGDPYVIEYNARMGDPETESVMPRLKTDLIEIFDAALNGTLDKIKVEKDPRFATAVMMVSGGYPGNYEKNKQIVGLDAVSDSLVFHAGTRYDENTRSYYTDGGRVLAVVGRNEELTAALSGAYTDAGRIRFENAYYRKDLGFDLQ